MSKNKERKISSVFISKLKEGFLAPFLKLIKADATLFLGIRHNYVNIYYRGGNLMWIKETGNPPSYIAKIDESYVKTPEILESLKAINSKALTTVLLPKWLELLPFLKREMDAHPKLGQEREFQQLIARDCNGLSIKGADTSPSDYFICDIEYSETFGNLNARLDMLGVLWESDGPIRKNNTDKKLAIIEVKFGDAAIFSSGEKPSDKKVSDIPEHIKDINVFLSNSTYLQSLKDDAKSSFNQLIELGLIKNKNKLGSFSEQVEYILILINHDPASSKLLSALQNSPLPIGAELKFAVSTFMGYRLFKENIYNAFDFLSRHKDSIYCKEYNHAALLEKFQSCSTSALPPNNPA